MGRFEDAQVWDHRDIHEAMQEGLPRCATLEGAAQRCVDILYRHFQGSLVLARLYATVPYARLPPKNQTFVQSLAQTKGMGSHLRDNTPVLSLLGTRGVEKAWNDRTQSKGHVGIPLLATSFVDGIPMLARLLQELGIGLEWIDRQDIREVERIMSGGLCSVFHVDDASKALDKAGRHIIPAQPFVKGYGVKSVFGMGGVYVGGTFVTFILFANETVSRPAAERLAPLVARFKAQTVPHVLKHLFFEDGPPSKRSA